MLISSIRRQIVLFLNEEDFSGKSEQGIYTKGIYIYTEVSILREHFSTLFSLNWFR